MYTLNAGSQPPASKHEARKARLKVDIQVVLGCVQYAFPKILRPRKLLSLQLLCLCEAQEFMEISEI